MSTVTATVTAVAVVCAALPVPVLPRLVGAFPPVDGVAPRLAVPGRLALGSATLVSLVAVAAAMYPHTARLPAYLYLTVVGVTLATIDLRVHRLPDLIVLPSYGVLAVLLVLPTVGEGAAGRWPRALAAGFVVWLLYGALHLLPGAGLGRGDVKLAGLLGLALGWLGWSEVAVWLVAATVLAGFWVLVLLILRRVSRRDPIAYGPFLLTGALVAVLCAGHAPSG
ncbi:leader peptidase (prepilin peptidase) / N-methyltransferase [Frankia sp. EI5c]|uniref:prepilin peptidase n=1 Tax=Frankia sp. EI5c TaxID=683316 RepID=UPI0007C2FB6D|nr:A24 family peptidase [Frankia sp. EI5c]OAA25904.1 leader peptidase (prepilin peptidase) / N-methyltransferase [Frankia sp. EI5c]